MREPIVDAVVFDLGGVLVDWDPEYLYRGLIPDEGRRETFLSKVCNLEWNAKMDRGVPFRTAIEKKQKDHPEWSNEVAAYFDRWPEMLGGPIEGTVKLLDELHATGIPLYALTNWSAETFPFAQARYSFLNRFEDVVVSGFERMAKPEMDFYNLLIERHRLDPARTLFIDDNDTNVQAARLAGLKAVTFTSPEALRKELVEHGLLRA